MRTETQRGRCGRFRNARIDIPPQAPVLKVVGPAGTPGRDGENADPEVVSAMVKAAIESLPKPKDGTSVTIEDVAPMIVQQVTEKVNEIPRPKDGENGDVGLRGPRGLRGEQGEQGDVGPVPDHRWDGTKLQFENPSGKFGKAVDLRGPKGEPGHTGYVASIATEPVSTSSDALEFAFAYGDATPAALTMILAGSLVYRVELYIHVPFDGVGAALTIGDAGQADRLLAADENDPSLVCGFFASPDVEYSVTAPLILSINPGVGATQGSGVILIFTKL